MAAVWAAGPEPIIATEECILRRWVEKGRVGGGGAAVVVLVVVVVALWGRGMDAARRGRVAVEERRVVKRLRVEENVVADSSGFLWEGKEEW